MRIIRRSLFLVLCLTLIFVLTGQTTFPQPYYVTARSANARSCPQTTCDIVVRLTRGTSITVEATETGTRVSGSDAWLRFDYQGTTAYVHSSLASTRRPNTTSSTTQATSTPAPASENNSTSVSCNGARTCTAMTSCDQAYACLAGGRESLDRDNDGVPCESICPGG